MDSAHLCCHKCNSSLLESLDPGEPHVPSLVPPSLFSSNEALSEIHAASVKQHISDMAQLRRGLDEKASALRNIVSKLDSAQQTLDDDIERHKGLISPARHLSSEIWSHIFEFATFDNFFSNNEPDSFSALDSPMILASICRSWRKRAIKTPTIWSLIRFEVAESPTDGFLLLLQSFLDRSCSLPLIIDVSVLGALDTWGSIRQMYDLLLMHSQRLSDVRLCLPFKHLEPEASSFSDAEFSQLRSLKLRDSEDVDHDRLSFPRSPILQSLSLDIYNNLNLTQNTFDWAALTTAEIDMDTSPFVFLDILRWSPNLKVFKAISYHDDDFQTLQTVYHSNLEDMAVKGLHDGSGILSKLELPSLTWLCIEASNAEPGEATNIANFLHLSKQLLEVEFSMSSYSFLLSVDSMDNLVSLQISFPYPYPAAVENFLHAFSSWTSSSNDAPVPFPSLKHLHINVSAKRWRRDLLLQLNTGILALCRQISRHSKPTKLPSIEKITLVADAPVDSYEFYMLRQTKMLGLDCLDIQLD